MGLSERIDKAVTDAVTIGQGGVAPRQLSAALTYATTPGGARIRPTILTSVAMACGDDQPQITDAAAAALELIHCASLVHDDLPCFDDAATRRGKPSVHRAYGEPLAVLTGDSLIVLAFEVLAKVAPLDPMRDPGAYAACLFVLVLQLLCPRHQIAAAKQAGTEIDTKRIRDPAVFAQREALLCGTVATLHKARGHKACDMAAQDPFVDIMAACADRCVRSEDHEHHVRPDRPFDPVLSGRGQAGAYGADAGRAVDTRDHPGDPAGVTDGRYRRAQVRHDIARCYGTADRAPRVSGLGGALSPDTRHGAARRGADFPHCSRLRRGAGVDRAGRA